MTSPKRSARRTNRGSDRFEDEYEPLTKAEIRELQRRIKDSRDPTRNLIVSRLLKSAKWTLYYNVTDDVWAMDQAGGTLFKRRKTANAVLRCLKGRGELMKVSLAKGNIKSIRRGFPKRIRVG